MKLAAAQVEAFLRDPGACRVILLYGDERMDSPTLVIPHPRMMARAFVLVPLAEIAPSRVNSAQLQAVSGQAITPMADC